MKKLNIKACLPLTAVLHATMKHTQSNDGWALDTACFLAAAKSKQRQKKIIFFSSSSSFFLLHSAEKGQCFLCCDQRTWRERSSVIWPYSASSNKLPLMLALVKNPTEAISDGQRYKKYTSIRHSLF